MSSQWSYEVYTAWNFVPIPIKWAYVGWSSKGSALYYMQRTEVLQAGSPFASCGLGHLQRHTGHQDLLRPQPTQGFCTSLS